jgi:antitoxin component YwqK of YwqJK toxin-antitoxin module
MRLLTILCLVLLVSCSQEPPLLLVRDGITYDQKTNEPVTGIVEKFYENGQLKWRTNFKDGKLDGLWEWFDNDGNLRSTDTWKNGELVETNSNP